MGFDVQLTAKQDNLYKPNKLGQSELVFGLWSEFVSTFVNAGLEVDVKHFISTKIGDLE